MKVLAVKYLAGVVVEIGEVKMCATKWGHSYLVRFIQLKK